VSPKRKTNQRVLRRRNGKIADRCSAVSSLKGDSKMVLEQKIEGTQITSGLFDLIMLWSIPHYVVVDTARI
jgi:hypothetical protein